MQCVVSDMTAFYVKGIYYELTIYMDLWNNEILSHSLSSKRGDRMTYISGLESLIELKKQYPEFSTILHSDQGSVYTSKAFNELLPAYNIIRFLSMRVQNMLTSAPHGVPHFCQPPRKFGYPKKENPREQRRKEFQKLCLRVLAYQGVWLSGRFEERRATAPKTSLWRWRTASACRGLHSSRKTCLSFWFLQDRIPPAFSYAAKQSPARTQNVQQGLCCRRSPSRSLLAWYSETCGCAPDARRMRERVGNGRNQCDFRILHIVLIFSDSHRYRPFFGRSHLLIMTETALIFKRRMK